MRLIQTFARHSATLFLMMFLYAGVCSAQSEKTLFGTRKLKSSGGWGGYRLQAGNIADQEARISSFTFIGEYERKFIAGYNFNWVSNDVPYRFEQKVQNIKLRWHSLQLGYMLAAHRVVHPIIELDLGIGRVKMNDIGKDRLFIASPSVGIELNLYRWFHLSLEGGYRAVTDVQLADLNNQKLSGAFGMLTLKFGWSDPALNNKQQDNK